MKEQNPTRFRCNIVEVQITHGCNNRCRYCSASALQPLGAGEAEMPQPLFQRLCQRLSREVDGGRLIITGGEPTTHSRFFEFLVYARQCLPGWVLHVQTNARLFNRRSATLLAAIGVDSVNVSFQSVNPLIHDELDGIPGAHGEAIAGLQHILAAAANYGRPDVAVNITISAINAQTLEATMRFLYGLGVHVVTGNIMRPYTAEMKHYRLDDAAAALVLEEAYRLAGTMGKPFTNFHSFNWCQFDPRGTPLKHYACTIGRKILAIDDQGNILPCLNIPSRRQTVLGHIEDATPLRQIWEGESLARYRRHEYTHTICRSCFHLESCGGVCLGIQDMIAESELKPFPPEPDSQHIPHRIGKGGFTK